MPASQQKVTLPGRGIAHTSPLHRSGIGGDFQVLGKLSEVEMLREDWRRIAVPNAMAFQSFGWNVSWLQHFRSQYDEIFVFVRRNKGRVVAILPCYGKGGLLRLVGDEICDFQDVVAENSAEAEKLVVEIMDWAKREVRRFNFRKLSERGILLPLIKRILPECGFVHHEKVYGRCPWLTLSSDGEEFLKGAKAKVRKRIRRALRRLDDLAPGHEKRFLGHDEITPETISDLGRLHEANQHRKAGASIFSREEYRSFLAAAGASEDVGMRVLELRAAGGELIAFDLCFESSNRFSAYLGAYDGPYAGGSPGVCLLHWQMDMLPLRGITEYDFLCGEEPYKFDYATESYEIVSARIYPNHFRGRLAVGSLRMLQAAKEIAKAILRKAGERK